MKAFEILNKNELQSIRAGESIFYHIGYIFGAAAGFGDKQPDQSPTTSTGVRG